MKYCPECGHRLDKGTEKFCPECGEKLGQAAASGRYDNKKSSIGITDTKGDVLGTDVAGSGNTIAKDIHGNFIQLQVTGLSYTDLQKIIKIPTQVDESHDIRTSTGDKKGIKKVQEITTTSQQANKVLDEIIRIEEKEGTFIQEIKAGELRISRKELLVKEYNLKGNVWYYKKQYNEAIKCYDKAIEIDPDNADAWINKGNALGKLGNYVESIDCYEKAIEIDPDNAYVWDNKGWALGELEMYKEVVECTTKAIELNPNYALAWDRKGYFLHQLGKYEEAIECYNRSIELDPNYAKVYDNKGNALTKLGKYEEAVECYDKALELDPNMTVAQENRDLAYKQL